MSINIIKAGIYDTVQDSGRYGYQHLGINPGGAMDLLSAHTANILVGNERDEAVLEIHFPASAFLFDQPAIIAIAGADFSATINGEHIPFLQPVCVNRKSILHFDNRGKGARAYIAIREKLAIEKWLGSYSTHLKAQVGGFHGRALKKDDLIGFVSENDYSKLLGDKDFVALPWQASQKWNDMAGSKIYLVKGKEWDLLNDDSKKAFQHNPFYISHFSDRMGYLMVGQTLNRSAGSELVSSAVGFGTIQLLPDGQMIILMADHQTTGGYPKIAHVISAHLSKLAQMKTAEEIHFEFVELETAEQLFIGQQQHLLQLENACKMKIEDFMKSKHFS
jgi:antagonist of KipI